MSTVQLNVVTGAYGFTGRHITERLLAAGERVLTLTGHPNRPSPFVQSGQEIAVAPLDFDDQEALVESMRGASVLFNTYWIRFANGETDHEKAVANTISLIRAAERAGVKRIIHISITNADACSTLPYFRGKGLVEQAIAASSLSHAIIRPALIFGRESILINNIAWLLRRFPVFVVPGAGNYRLQPINVADLAGLAINAARQEENIVIDAVGPETFTFDQLVRQIAGAVGSRAKIVHFRPGLVLALGKLIGHFVQDVVLTDDEVKGLTANLLVSSAPPNGPTRLSEWLQDHANQIGIKYFSEFRQHYR